MVMSSRNYIATSMLLTLVDIYGHGKNITKSKAYLALRPPENTPSVLTSWDRIEHGRKRRAVAHGFTEMAVRGYEPIIKEKIELLCQQLLNPAEEAVKNEGSDQWSPPRDMALWSKSTLRWRMCDRNKMLTMIAN